MKRLLLVIITFLALSAPSEAAHIKGGFFTYRYLGPGTAPGTNRYNITLTVYMLCSATPAQISNPINFSIFNGRTFQFIQNANVNLTNQYQLGKSYDEPCITDNQAVCYYTIVVYDLPSIDLASSPDGYIIAYQRCCRILGIQNLVPPSGEVGNTFSIAIPGTSSPVPNAEQNSSPLFLVNDTAVICRGSFFSYPFQASDINVGDSLAYEFCNAIEGGSVANSAPVTAANPPYFSVPYQAPYSGTQPMGPGVTINPTTGLISGIAPAASGEYVISVCVKEYRAGLLIGITRKELHIRVGDCDPLNASLAPKPTTCDGFAVTFSNDVTNPPGATYHWTFGEPSSGSQDTSFLEFPPPHIYAAAGTYTVRLRVSLAGLCIDSADLVVNVFPGFFPGFRAAGSCITSPFLFTDTTRTDFGVVDSWSWNFGDETTLADTSHLQHPQWTYATGGTKTVTLTVTNSKGCRSTISTTITILDKPIITLAFRDTLICRNDALQLNATGTGVFSWTPNINIINANTGTPTVSPTSTTWYYVNLNDNGCINNDSVRVRVVNSVTLRAINDTTICQGDAIQLGATSDGL
ncbi:MAG: PKD domain-containing protein, partial [Chitinophagaceae bacterium]|nr:PKD domain-containing protein [Chitinophagaceae bacterium]